MSVIRACDIVRDPKGRRCVVYQIYRDGVSDWFYVVYPDGETDAFQIKQLSLVKPALG